MTNCYGPFNASLFSSPLPLNFLLSSSSQFSLGSEEDLAPPHPPTTFHVESEQPPEGAAVEEKKEEGATLEQVEDEEGEEEEGATPEQVEEEEGEEESPNRCVLVLLEIFPLFLPLFPSLPSFIEGITS